MFIIKYLVINKLVKVYSRHKQTHTHTLTHHTNSRFFSYSQNTKQQSVFFLAVQQQIYRAPLGLRRLLYSVLSSRRPGYRHSAVFSGNYGRQFGGRTGFSLITIVVPYQNHSTIFRTLSIIHHPNHVKVILETASLSNT
jgi:putative salt-induced outer membrane protein YdiY